MLAHGGREAGHPGGVPGLPSARGGPVLEAATGEWVGPLGGQREGLGDWRRPLGDGGAQLAPSGGGAPGFSGLW